MIVHDLDLVGISVSPDEADPPLVINANAMLTSPLALESL